MPEKHTNVSIKSVPRHISACGPGVLRSGDLAAHHATGFEHLSQKKYFASPGGESSSTTRNCARFIMQIHIRNARDRN